MRNAVPSEASIVLQLRLIGTVSGGTFQRRNSIIVDLVDLMSAVCCLCSCVKIILSDGVLGLRIYLSYEWGWRGDGELFGGICRNS